jgi:hypothetical protein
MDQRMADETILSQAMGMIDDEEMRQVPVRSRLSLEGALEKADGQVRQVVRNRASKAGRAPKTDALQKEIEKIIAGLLTIKTSELAEKLTPDHYPDLIENVTEGSIEFHDGGKV